MALSGRPEREARNSIASRRAHDDAAVVPQGYRFAEPAAFVDVIAHVVVLHELKKSGALTYEEFAILKGRLLDL